MHADFEPIRITEVIASEVGSPRNDGTPGSALYSVPFRLSRSAPAEWGSLFVRAWDHPSSFSTMHRPGIASAHGDRIVLNGTTMEEVEKVHRETLKLAVDQANADYVKLVEQRSKEEARKKEAEEQHRKSVEEISKRIRFDDHQ